MHDLASGPHMLKRHLPDCLSCSPYLQITDLLHFLLILLTVVGLGVEVQRSLGLGAILDAVVQVIEYRF